MGLYRGLKLKTEGTPWDVEIIDVPRASSDQLPQGPVILCAMLEPGNTRIDEYQGEWGWIPGVPHSVVYMRPLDDGSHLMVDPFVGVESWSPDDVNVLWQGQGMRLVRRAPGEPVFPFARIAALTLGE